MTFKEIPPTAGTRKQSIPFEDLCSFVDDFPALLWRIEIAKSRIEFLNDHVIAPLGHNTRLVLQNAEFRNSILLPEDAPMVANFLDAIRDGRTMATVFRVRGKDNETLWLKLTGSVNRRDPRYYYGYLLDVRDTAKIIQDITASESDERLRMDNAPVPVLLAEYTTGRLSAANAVSRNLFRLPKELARSKRTLAAITPRAMDKPLERVLRDLPQARTWEGTLEFVLPGGEPFAARTELRYITRRDTGLVRLALSVADVRRAQERARRADAPAQQPGLPSADALIQSASIPELVNKAMASPAMERSCDALMLSDIHIRRNNVVVYGAGAPLRGTLDGETFSYAGTIAEDIVRFGLDHLVVDDTMDSIKPIDWALFIPRGIRSYFAKPFYERKILRTVLILCSTDPNRFSECSPNAFDDLLSPLIKAARVVRTRRDG